VEKDASKAQRLGVSGTPTFFINGHLFSGPQKYDSFRDAIDKELASASPGKVTQDAMTSSPQGATAKLSR
jgi:predicted DsbA family dithiol-disulfide isomerase